MNVTLVEESHKTDWDRFVENSPGVIAWHSHQYSELLARHHRTKFLPLAVYDGARIVGILPLYHTRTLRSGDALISVPFFVAGGIVADEPAVRTILLARALDLAKELKIGRLVLKQYKVKIDGPLSTDDGYYNRELDISRNLDEVWQSLAPINREKIEESSKLDLALEYPSDNVALFFEFLFRDQHAAGVPCVSKAWVRSLFDTGSYKIALLRYRGEVVAATMAKKFKDTISFPFSCVCDHGEHATRCAYDLYWKLITKSAQEGLRIVHSGRIPVNDDVPAYRLGWGGTKYSYYYQCGSLSAGAAERTPKTEVAPRRGARRRLVESVWKQVPVPIARVLGPAVVSQFP